MRHQNRLQHLLAGAASAALTLAVSSHASAQTAASGAAETSPSEVVVTAEKRSEKLLSVPAPVSALTGADLRRLGAVQLSDYTAQVPGLNLISDREGESEIVIRGITTGLAANSTVSTYIDDTPYGSSTLYALGGLLTPDLDPSDIQRIEVLRGPQGTLYGASSMGGLIKYVTTSPSLNQFGGRVEVDGSTVNSGGEGYGVRGLLNIPLISDQLAVRVSAYDRLDPGYIGDAANGETDLNHTRVDGGRVSVLWQPVQRFSLKLSALFQDLNGPGSSDEDIDGTTLKPLYGDLQQRRSTEEFLRVRYRSYNATANYDFGFATLTSITSWGALQQNQNFDDTSAFGPTLDGLLGPALGTSNLGVGIGSNIGETRFSQEVRLASDPGKFFDWQVGFFFDHERSTRIEPGTLVNLDTNKVIDPTPILGDPLARIGLLARYTEYSGFGDLTLHLTSKLDVQGGVRYSTNDQHYSQPEDGILVGGPSFAGGTSSQDSTTFLVTASYKFDPANMLYGRIASGYRPGGPNALTPALSAAGVPTAFQADTLTNYEVGYKAALLDHKLTLDLSAFYIDWENIQILTTFDGLSTEGNGKSARSEGFEGAFTYVPVRGLTLSGNVAYTEANLTGDAPGVNGKDGDELPNVPKWAATINADYNFPITADMGGFVGGTVRYIGDRESDFVTGSPAGFQRPVIPSYTTVDIRAGVIYKGLTFEGYLKNLGDVRGFNNITSNALDGYSAPFTAAVIQPMTAGFSLSAAF